MADAAPGPAGSAGVSIASRELASCWWPALVCPECRGALERRDDGHRCRACDLMFASGGRIARFLAPARAERADAFHRQYRQVRERDGHGGRPAEVHRALPFVRDRRDDTFEWRIRRASFASLMALLRERGKRAARVLDAGAGTGWLSNQLAVRSHRPVALDRYDDHADGLGVCAAYERSFPAIQADFDALPFEGGQFDAVVFNASLHYSPDISRTIGEAARVLASDGVVAVMDSPTFESVRDGEEMVRQQSADLQSRFGVEMPLRAGIGFITREQLTAAARVRGWKETFVPTRGPISWRLRRWWGSRHLDRAPAAFGVWVAQ